MKTLYVNRAPVDGPWGGGNNFVKAVYKYAATFGYQIVDKIINDVDVILITDHRYDDVKKFSMNEAIRYKQAFPKTKVVYRVNECDKRKGETEIIDPLIRETSKNSDLTILHFKPIAFFLNCAKLGKDFILFYLIYSALHFPQ